MIPRNILTESTLHPNYVDLDLVMFDLRDEFEKDEQRALSAVQLLLLDELTCRARIEWLGALGRAAATDPKLAGFCDILTGEDFRKDIQLLVDVGIFRALKQRLITLDRLDAMLRNPDVLWTAHQAFAAIEDVRQVDVDDTRLVHAEHTLFTSETPTGGMEIPSPPHRAQERHLPDVQRPTDSLQPQLLDEAVRRVRDRFSANKEIFEAFRLTVIDGLSIGDAAKALKVTEQEVEVFRIQVLNQLKQALGY